VPNSTTTIPMNRLYRLSLWSSLSGSGGYAVLLLHNGARVILYRRQSESTKSFVSRIMAKDPAPICIEACIHKAKKVTR